VGATVLALAGCGNSAPRSDRQVTTASTQAATGSTQAATGSTQAATATAPPPPKPKPRPRAPYAVSERELTFTDNARRRRLVTIVRFPKAPGRFPLIVFGHGFAVTPAPYSALLHAWARAGYVVAAPVFPFGNANAPGGPNEQDLVNQPRDVSFVITRMLADTAARSGVLAGRIDPRKIAVSGQSDGGDTALAVAYDPRYRDARVGTSVILSGAEIPYLSPIHFSSPSPPLLAMQGTADTINPPSFTSTFFDVAPPPKYLVRLIGAPHLPPYTDMQPQLGIVERTSLAFLDYYLKGRPEALRRMAAAATVPGTAELTADPPIS
jgi:dienelactone hydrolase